MAAATGQPIALDIGGVCLRLRPVDSARLLGYDTMRTLSLAHPPMHGYVQALETGRMEEEEFLALVSGMLGNVSVGTIKRAWYELLGEEIEGMRELVTEMVDAGYRPVFLSDISPYHHQCVLELLSFAHLVDSAVVSYRVGALKPGREMYEAFETHCGGRKPALYLDDKLCNVNAARKLGWNSHHFAGVEGARQAFRKLEGKE
jgi:FMN phosphatase YigB (HAD superfamily)